eukprot:1140635-Pelagomonas_calceolata.AAC.4
MCPKLGPDIFDPCVLKGHTLHFKAVIGFHKAHNRAFFQPRVQKPVWSLVISHPHLERCSANAAHEFLKELNLSRNSTLYTPS